VHDASKLHSGWYRDGAVCGWRTTLARSAITCAPPCAWLDATYNRCGLQSPLNHLASTPPSHHKHLAQLSSFNRSPRCSLRCRSRCCRRHCSPRHPPLSHRLLPPPRRHRCFLLQALQQPWPLLPAQPQLSWQTLPCPSLRPQAALPLPPLRQQRPLTLWQQRWQ
jgi:hypothetical protein